MKRHIAMLVTAVLLSTLACSIAWSEQSGNILARRLSSAQGQECRRGLHDCRANKRDPDACEQPAEVGRGRGRPSHHSHQIRQRCEYLLQWSVVHNRDPSRRKVNNTTTESLAAIWAQRLRTILPNAIPEKPGVGYPLQPDGSRRLPRQGSRRSGQAEKYSASGLPEMELAPLEARYIGVNVELGSG